MTSTDRKRLLALGLAACFLTAGCGNPGPDPDFLPAPSSTGAPTRATPSAEPPAPTLLDVCSLLSVEEVGAVLGGPVTLTGTGDRCRFIQPAARAVRVTVSESLVEPGTDPLAGVRSGVRAVIDGPARQLPSLGGGAFVVVGTTVGSKNQQGSGAALVAGSLVQVTLVQLPGLPASDVRGQVVDVLELIADQT